MRTLEIGPLPGEIIDEHAVLTLAELSRLCAVDPAFIVALVDEGVVHAVDVGAELRLPGHASQRIRIALRLQRDLEINLPGIALALQLMEEIEALRREFGVRLR